MSKADVLYAARAAQKILDAQSIHGVLVGTAGLAALGIVDFSDNMDVDFFCHTIPLGDGIELMDRMPGTYQHLVAKCYIQGVEVQFVENDRDDAERFLTRSPETIAGIKVAALRDILGLKKWGNREKDRMFFEYHPKLAALVSDIVPASDPAEWQTRHG